MGEPRNARSGPQGRQYVWPETGETFVSVTTVLDVIDKPALMRWAAKKVAEYAVTERDNWDRLDAAAAVDLLKGAPWRYTEERIELGTSVHAATEAYMKGENGPVYPGEVAGYMAQFMDFLKTAKPTIEQAEVSVYNRKHAYAGTLDLLCQMDGRLLLIDYKTGKRAYPEAELQLAAYAGAEFIGLDDGTELPMPQIDRAAVLLLRPRHWELLPARLTTEIYDAFTHAVALWRWQANLAGDAFTRRWVPPKEAA